MSTSPAPSAPTQENQGTPLERHERKRMQLSLSSNSIVLTTFEHDLHEHMASGLRMFGPKTSLVESDGPDMS